MTEGWDEAVLEVLRRTGRNTTLQEIYREMEDHPLVTPRHKEYWGGQPNYQHSIRSSLARLKKRGVVSQVGRAVYVSA